ncbi:MAG TPA: alpha-amylase family glycosyl hydrolase [Candidatus Lokiarchaeia archaeon]|nr:alpha-amylase family glycosyl hydrolase [Candidatus Lokiarchaeia archaeon]
MPGKGIQIYNLFPRLLGSIDAWTSHLERIKEMGFDWIYTNPLNYPGFSGSLYSIKDFYRFNPAFAPEGAVDPYSWEPLKAFIDACHDRGLKFMVDLVINHTAVDSELVSEHPDWYKKTNAVVRNLDGHVVFQFPLDEEPPADDEYPEDEFTIEERIAHPSAIDPSDDRIITIWGDLAEIDHVESTDLENLLVYWCDLVTFYLDLGIDGFRCDAAYQVPATTWKSIIDMARGINPGVVFAAETLGCTLPQLKETVSAGFDYIYNSSKYWDFTSPWCPEQYEAFRKFSPSISFPESHDTKRLAFETSGREDVQRFRYLFAAFFSSGVMMPIGYEYGFNKAIDVCDTTPADWESPAFDISDFIGKVNAFKARFRCLNEDGPMKHFEYLNLGILVLRKTSLDNMQHLLLVYNKDWNNAQEVTLDSLSYFLDLKAPISRVDIDTEDVPVEESSWRATLRPNEHVFFFQEKNS